MVDTPAGITPGAFIQHLVNIIPFSFDSHSSVRSILLDGEPWLHAADVCAALGHSNPSKAVSDHVEPEDKAAISLGLPGSPPTFVNESGLYALIFMSHLPAAARFRKWITKEVLPSIRKTGAYGLTAKSEAALEVVRRVHEQADREVEHRTRHDFYRPSARAREHTTNIIAEVAQKHGLDAASVALGNQHSVDKVMAETYGDPVAIARVERQRLAVEATVRERVRLQAPRRYWKARR